MTRKNIVNKDKEINNENKYDTIGIVAQESEYDTISSREQR